MIGGGPSLDTVMSALARDRPVFHSEADFQHAFARVLWDLAPNVQSRLEVRQAPSDDAQRERREYVDLVCRSPLGTTAIEFKYFTRAWTGNAGDPPERFDLRAHGAEDLARLHFVSDIVRLERFCPALDANGIAVLLTNEPRLWEAQTGGARPPTDLDFRLHGRRVLSGTLRWAEGAFPANARTLRGNYELSWRDYSRVGDGRATFRWLAVEVGGAATRVT